MQTPTINSGPEREASRVWLIDRDVLETNPPGPAAASAVAGSPKMTVKASASLLDKHASNSRTSSTACIP